MRSLECTLDEIDETDYDDLTLAVNSLVAIASSTTDTQKALMISFRECEYVFDRPNNEYFDARIDMSFRRNRLWGIREANPMFAIGDEKSFMAICIFGNSTILASVIHLVAITKSRIINVNTLNVELDNVVKEAIFI